MSIKKSKIQIVLAVAFLSLFLLWTLVLNACTKGTIEDRVIAISREQMHDFTYPCVDEIQFYYFSRSECPDCKIFNDELNEWCNFVDITLLYYDAQHLFESDRPEYDAFKDHLHVDGVPSVLVVQNGTVIQLLSGTTIRTDLESFLSSR